MLFQKFLHACESNLECLYLPETTNNCKPTLPRDDDKIFLTSIHPS